MSRNADIDNVDLKILSLLTKDAKMPYTEVAKKVFVSGGTVHVRMRKLEEMGVVKGTTLDIDYAQMGYDITAFLGIYLQKSSLYDEVIDQLKLIPEIVKIHYTTGNYNIFVKIHCKDTKHLKDTLHDKIQKVEGIERTETIISLEQSMSRHIQFDE
ncbi:Lrp/AsnC ligand binding domain-containing protein [Aureibacter tunicatorum]|uniref:Lrp/AsnC family transcriptional regulator for asnA, asnC and gidA n=1 Tax=Aureibacter tunicatorum TaxID=866807 RepID=A0AAE3XPG5_9BACT|nr:Lrp/AsnC ligand binding domain-containing protein [Aureibacter tunicatorum]MDR6239640.1 Lrp/AsnC family transcriptional regulator for asnA, asnC and gidA [Aureibacter tunicatorum]BDD04116.1 AsnC family transcriptional regulator [Aureibacter tunicatorum]